MFNKPAIATGAPQFNQRQTAAASNNFQAQAHAAADPRFAMKEFDRAGFSRGAGQASYGAAKAAGQYADLMNQSSNVGMQDYYYNANQALDSQIRGQQFGLALAGLNEDVAQSKFDASMSMMNSMMSPFKKALAGTSDMLKQGVATQSSPPTKDLLKKNLLQSLLKIDTQSSKSQSQAGSRNISTDVAGFGNVVTTVPAGGDQFYYRTLHKQRVAEAHSSKR